MWLRIHVGIKANPYLISSTWLVTTESNQKRLIQNKLSLMFSFVQMAPGLVKGVNTDYVVKCNKYVDGIRWPDLSGHMLSCTGWLFDMI